MHVFKEIDKSSTIIEGNIVNYTQTLSASSAGVQSIKVVSGSINDNYWNSLNVLFYGAKPLFKEPNKHFRNALEYRKRSKFSFI